MQQVGRTSFFSQTAATSIQELVEQPEESNCHLNFCFHTLEQERLF
jgi:hypothetical protein